MSDGHLGKCKTCAKRDVTKYRWDNIDTVRARENAQKRDPVKQREITKAWRAEDSRRTHCHNAVRRAVKSGKLIIPASCKCGREKVGAHHDDYDKPLDVMWLCQACHKQRHKELDAL